MNNQQKYLYSFRLMLNNGTDLVFPVELTPAEVDHMMVRAKNGEVSDIADDRGLHMVIRWNNVAVARVDRGKPVE